jgi:hypothetical protein
MISKWQLIPAVLFVISFGLLVGTISIGDWIGVATNVVMLLTFTILYVTIGIINRNLDNG